MNLNNIHKRSFDEFFGDHFPLNPNPQDQMVGENAELPELPPEPKRRKCFAESEEIESEVTIFQEGELILNEDEQSQEKILKEKIKALEMRNLQLEQLVSEIDEDLNNIQDSDDLIQQIQKRLKVQRLISNYPVKNDEGVCDRQLPEEYLKAILADWTVLEYFPDYIRNNWPLINQVIEHFPEALIFVKADTFIKVIKEKGTIFFKYKEEIHFLHELSKKADQGNLNSMRIINRYITAGYSLQNLKASRVANMQPRFKNIELHSILNFVSGEALENEELAKLACKYQRDALKFFSHNINNNPQIFKWIIEQGLWHLDLLSHPIKNKEVVRLVLEQDGEALKFVSEDLKDEEIVGLALLQDEFSLEDIPENLRTEEIVRLSMQQDGWAFEFVPEHLQTEEIVRLALQHDGKVLKVVPEKLITEEIVKLAVQQDAIALAYAPRNLITEEIVRSAVQKDGRVLYYVPENLITAEIARWAVEENGRALEYVPENLITEEIVRSALQMAEMILEYVPGHLITAEIARLAVQRNGQDLAYVPGHLITEEIVRLAVESNGYALAEVPEHLITKEIVRLALKEYGKALQFVPKALITEEIVTWAVEENGGALKFAPPCFKNNIDIVSLAIQKNKYWIVYASEEVRERLLLQWRKVKKGFIKV